MPRYVYVGVPMSSIDADGHHLSPPSKCAKMPDKLVDANPVSIPSFLSRGSDMAGFLHEEEGYK